MNILDRYELQPTTGGYRFRDTTNLGPSGLLKCTMTEALLYELLRALHPPVLAEVANVSVATSDCNLQVEPPEYP